MRIESGGNFGFKTLTPSTDFDFNGNVRLRSGLYDSNNELGTSGQVLSSTGTGTDWVDAAGGSGDNLSNANLTYDASHSYDLAGFQGFWFDGTDTTLYIDSARIGIRNTSPQLNFDLLSGENSAARFQTSTGNINLHLHGGS